MYSDKKQSKTKYIIFALALILTAALIYGLFGHSGRDISLEGAEAIKDAIVRSARQCYVVEGVYPPNLEYLEDHYGLQINTKDYYVNYDAFSSNLPPDVIVLVRPKE
ncbi:MAG: hypothetical protein IJM08_07865 [Firmicutes bacterium]|nr:hypothetical protein [Bacillota bacterium]